MGTYPSDSTVKSYVRTECVYPVLVVRVVACSVHREHGYEWECTTS